MGVMCAVMPQQIAWRSWLPRAEACIKQERPHIVPCGCRWLERLTIVMGWSMKEKPSESPDSKAIVRMPSAAPTMDPAIASRLLWKADPMLLLNVTTTARSNRCFSQQSSSTRQSMQVTSFSYTSAGQTRNPLRRGALEYTPTEMTIQTLASPRNSYVLLVTMKSIPRPIAVAICIREQRQLTHPSQWMRIVSLITQSMVSIKIKSLQFNPIAHYLSSKAEVLAPVPKSEASLLSLVQHPLRHLRGSQLFSLSFGAAEGP